MFISFIIPLYNCEKYISRCIGSILASNLSSDDYEIIIVNDGSKDNGPNIVKEYSEKHSCIKLLSQKNKGASAARNLALNEAQGDYIWFVDGDDAIIPSFISIAQNYLKNSNTELLCFNYQKLYNDHTKIITDFNQIETYSGVEFFRGHYSNFIWNKIYKRSAINNIRFLDGTKNIEDMFFNMCTIINMEQILCIPDLGYQYNCCNMSSTSRNLSLRNLVKLDQDSVTVLNALNNLANKQTDKERKAVLQDDLNFSLAGHLYSLFRYYSPQRLRKRIDQYKQLGMYPVGKSWNKRGNKFLLLANRKWLIVSIMRIGQILK